MGNERYIVFTSIGNDEMETVTFQDDWLHACKGRKECQGWILDTDDMEIYGHTSEKVRKAEQDFEWYILAGFYDHGILAEKSNPRFKLNIGSK